MQISIKQIIHCLNTLQALVAHCLVLVASQYGNAKDDGQSTVRLLQIVMVIKSQCSQFPREECAIGTDSN